jgi:hypothetical protein
VNKKLQVDFEARKVSAPLKSSSRINGWIENVANTPFVLLQKLHSSSTTYILDENFVAKVAFNLHHLHSKAASKF